MENPPPVAPVCHDDTLPAAVDPRNATQRDRAFVGSGSADGRPAGHDDGVAADLCIAFLLRGLAGMISVSVSRNEDPGALGHALLWPGLPADTARDFPVCRATVTYPADGYAAVFGWTQVVRSTDSGQGRFDPPAPGTLRSAASACSLAAAATSQGSPGASST